MPDHHSSFFFRMVSVTLSRPLPSRGRGFGARCPMLPGMASPLSEEAHSAGPTLTSPVSPRQPRRPRRLPNCLFLSCREFPSPVSVPLSGSRRLPHSRLWKGSSALRGRYRGGPGRPAARLWHRTEIAVSSPRGPGGRGKIRTGAPGPPVRHREPLDPRRDPLRFALDLNFLFLLGV